MSGKPYSKFLWWLRRKNFSCPRLLRFISILVLGCSVAMAWGYPHKVASQTLRPETIAAQVYEKLSFIPLANTYISKETNQSNNNSTLVSRFVSYHQYVKNRLTPYRLDWKLTMADYLEANETIAPNRYPGNTTLTENPLAGDKSALQQMSRKQRNELIAVILAIYNPQQPAQLDTSSPVNTPKIPFPKPGDAQLLQP